MWQLYPPSAPNLFLPKLFQPQKKGFPLKSGCKVVKTTNEVLRFKKRTTKINEGTHQKSAFFFIIKTLKIQNKTLAPFPRKPSTNPIVKSFTKFKKKFLQYQWITYFCSNLKSQWNRRFNHSKKIIYKCLKNIFYCFFLPCLQFLAPKK